jgi:signal peptidase I
LVLTLAVALGIRQFLLEARYIPSGSMLPGLQLQDRLLVEKLSYRGRAPQRGEIIVFHAPHHFDPVLSPQQPRGPLTCLLVNIPVIGSLEGLQQPACDAYIKRVIGLPGERVAVDPRGRVSINGQKLDEPYVKTPCPVNAQGVGPCRFWPGGPFLPQSEIIGRAFWRFYPFNKMGSLGPTTPSQP